MSHNATKVRFSFGLHMSLVVMPLRYSQCCYKFVVYLVSNKCIEHKLSFALSSFGLVDE